MLYRKLLILAVLLIMTLGVFHMPTPVSGQSVCGTEGSNCGTSWGYPFPPCCPGYYCVALPYPLVDKCRR
jgi:hypothetical protein